ncbi:Serine/threonine kinase mps1 [Thecaphora frezii]
MTTLSRTNLPPSTPVHLGGGLKRDHASLATPADSIGRRHLADMSPTQDSPLPPAPVSAFIHDEESDDDARKAAASASSTITSAAAAAPIPETRQAVLRTRATLSRATRERPPISDEDSPGVARRAPAASSLKPDDLGVPRASYLLQSERARLSGGRSSPIVKGEEHLDGLYMDRKSSPGASQAHQQSVRAAQGASGARYRSAHAPVSSSIYGKAGESSRPGYGSVGRSTSYGSGGQGAEAAKDEARIATRSSMNSIASGHEGRSRPSSSSAAPDPFHRRLSRTPPSELRGQSFVPKRRSFGELAEDLDLGARPLGSHESDGAPSGSRASSRNGYAHLEEPHEKGADGIPRSAARRQSDEKEAAIGRDRPRFSGASYEGSLDGAEAPQGVALNRSRSPPPPPAPASDLARSEPADEEEEQRQFAAPERSPPRARPEHRSDTNGVAAEASSAAALSGYRTPAMGGRALRSSLAASNGARSAGRSLRKLGRSSNHHVPARRVQRYQDEEEDEDLDDEAKVKGDNENGSGSNSPGDARDAAEGGGGGESQASGGSSGSGDRGYADARDGISPHLRVYGYDPVQAKSRAELLERASLVRSPSPKLVREPNAYEDDEAVEERAGADAPPPPPSKKEQHPNARRAAAAADGVARQENVEPAARRRTVGANAMQDILAAKVPAPGIQPPSHRRGVDAVVPARSAFAHSAAQNQTKAGAAPLVPSSVPPPPPEGLAEGEEIDDEIYRQYSDCRPDLIWGEAERQLAQPLANHGNLMELVKGPPKATAMQGLKYRKVKKAGRGGFSVVWVVRGPLYEPSPTNPQEVEEVPEHRQAFFALKQVSLKEVESEQNRQELISEANTLRTLANLEGSEKYLLRYFGHRVSNDKLKILLELGDGDFNGILSTQAPLSRELIAHYWREMLEAVQFIHDVNLVHTDLKPANFLIVKNRIKLIDFGIAQNIPKGTVHISRDAIIGTPNYMAPEAIKIAKAKGRRVYKAGKPSDVWSLGCILYQMIWGRPPFDKLPSDRKLEGIMDPNHKIAYPPYRDPRYPEVEDVDADMLDCVRSALQYRVEDRATIPQLLQHPFLRSPTHHNSAPDGDRAEEGDLDEMVSISRATLRKLVERLRVLALRDELTEENVVERADLLFSNLKQAQSS